MTYPSPQPRRGPAERALAWVMTGPVGHLWSAVADLAVFGASRLSQRSSRR